MSGSGFYNNAEGNAASSGAPGSSGCDVPIVSFSLSTMVLIPCNLGSALHSLLQNNCSVTSNVPRALALQGQFFRHWAVANDRSTDQLVEYSQRKALLTLKGFVFRKI